MGREARCRFDFILIFISVINVSYYNVLQSSFYFTNKKAKSSILDLPSLQHDYTQTVANHFFFFQQFDPQNSMIIFYILI